MNERGTIKYIEGVPHQFVDFVNVWIETHTKEDRTTMPSNVTKSEYDASLPGHVMCSVERAEKEVMAKKYERLEMKLGFFVDLCTKNVPQTPVANGTSTPMNPLMMNLTTPQSLSRVNSSTFSCNEPTPSAKLCELLDWDDSCVAVAKEVIDPIHRANCHNYVLDPLLELKVTMVTRKIFSAKLYNAEKNPDAKTIGEVGVGDFLVWHKPRVKYIEQ